MRAQVVVLLVPIALLVGCKEASSTSEALELPSAEGLPAGTLPECDQSCQDSQVVRALGSAMVFLFNQNLVGKPSGNVDVTADCANGGKARLHGSASSNHSTQTTTMDLEFDFQGCRVVSATQDLTL